MVEESAPATGGCRCVIASQLTGSMMPTIFRGCAETAMASSHTILVR